ncbi:MAG: hypothetical protein HXX08_11185 [Chloroflexi bacterium]|uniref:Uncharacterized protein n=1 Tax=Candidatus Chlorohelix allophototropha TaxID=3003348 RepID=A0A8T7M0U0_9CHLR|nr:hypothetical protein [Chloroflexota bacterium]WJW65800.1 hypothetical protein OZ401_001579 [Chloroflexota bacterium L227-S17]
MSYLEKVFTGLVQEFPPATKPAIIDDGTPAWIVDLEVMIEDVILARVAVLETLFPTINQAVEQIARVFNDFLD